MKSEKFKRPTRGMVRKSAKDGPKGGGGPPLFNLPDGMEQWIPTKSGIYKIDVVPYPVRETEHPERIKKGVLWCKRMVRVHGTPAGKVVCPKSVFSDRKCRHCNQFFKLRKEFEENEEMSDKAKDKALQPFKGQSWECFFILHPKDPTKVAFFAMSYGKFAKKLNEVCETTSQKNLLYFETDKNGKTLKCTFNEKKFNGNKFIECVNLEFKSREPIDEDMVMSQVVDIASVCNVLDDDKLKKLFYQNDDEDDEAPKKKSSDEDEDATSDEEDSDEDSKPKKKKKKVMAKDKSDKKKSKKSKDESEEKPAKKKLKKKEDKKAKKPEKIKKGKKAKDEEDSDDDEEE